jgi:hypothetical protein
MKKGVFLFLIVAAAAASPADDKKSQEEVCTDEEAMVASYRTSLADLIATVQKENLAEFERAFHRRSCLSKLGLCEGILDAANACYDEALKKPSMPKATLEACRAKREAFAKLKEKLVRYREALKEKEDDKSAKALIATFEVGN